MKITKKALIAALKQQDFNTELFPTSAYDEQHKRAHAEAAIARAFQSYLDINVAVGATCYTLATGKPHASPRWLCNLVRDCTWVTRRMICVGDLMYSLS